METVWERNFVPLDVPIYLRELVPVLKCSVEISVAVSPSAVHAYKPFSNPPLVKRFSFAERTADTVGMLSVLFV